MMKGKSAYGGEIGENVTSEQSEKEVYKYFCETRENRGRLTPSSQPGMSVCMNPSFNSYVLSPNLSTASYMQVICRLLALAILQCVIDGIKCRPTISCMSRILDFQLSITSRLKSISPANIKSCHTSSIR